MDSKRDNMKKGQGAAEYLILLAIVLIVAMIGIVLLGGFSDTGAKTMDAESHAYWSGTARPFAIKEWVQINDTLYLEIENKEISRFVLTNISFDGSMKNLSGGGWVFSPSAVKSISLGGFPMCHITEYDSFSYDVVFYYESEDISGKTQMGVKPLTGYCAFN